LIAERKIAESFDERVCDNFEKHHEPGLRVRGHGEVALERSGTISSADPGAEDKGVAAVECGGWLDDNRSRRVHHEIFGEIPYLVRYLSVF
jgi:hypothetical protein